VEIRPAYGLRVDLRIISQAREKGSKSAVPGSKQSALVVLPKIDPRSHRDRSRDIILGIELLDVLRDDLGNVWLDRDVAPQVPVDTTRASLGYMSQ